MATINNVALNIQKGEILRGLMRKGTLVTKLGHAIRFISAALMIMLMFMTSSVIAANPPSHSEKKTSSVIKIVTPKKNEVLHFQPVTVSVGFNGPIDPASFRAWLNKREVTQRFTVSAAGAQANLGEQDGLRIDSRHAGELAKNKIQVSIKDAAKKHTFKAKRKFYFDSKPPEASGVVSPQGGQVTLPGFGEVTFPVGAFASPREVRLSATSDPEIAAEWEETSHLSRPGMRAVYELRINVGTARPQTDVHALIPVPTDFLAKVPGDSEIQIFADFYQDGGEEIISGFEPLDDPIYSATNNTVTVTIPREVFTHWHRADDTYEAVILLSTTPTKPDVPATPPAS